MEVDTARANNFWLSHDATLPDLVSEAFGGADGWLRRELTGQEAIWRGIRGDLLWLSRPPPSIMTVSMLLL